MLLLIGWVNGVTARAASKYVRLFSQRNIFSFFFVPSRILCRKQWGEIVEASGEQLLILHICVVTP